MATTDGIPLLVSAFIGKRDEFSNRYRQGGGGLVALTGAKVNEFDDLINGHAAQLAALLPDMSLAEWEGLSQLVNSRLNDMRRTLESGR